MNLILKVLIVTLIIIVIGIYLRNKSLTEHFKTETNNKKRCYPWSKSVQFKYLAESAEEGEEENYNTCRNPENDINGNWCYTDQYGNYDYCDSFDPGCMKLNILEGCFSVDPDNYELVVYNSQPFEEDHLELGQVVDSFNYIWCIDKGRRYLRIANKKGYINYTILFIMI